MWQKVSTYLSSLLVATVSLLVGCSGSQSGYGAMHHATVSSTMMSQVPAQPMASGPMPKHIALLLPVTGPLAAQASAIRNGFFAAYYQDKQQGSAPVVKVYDTQPGNIPALYQQALAEGADFVVGPLTKDNVAQLVSGPSLSVPTLALNTLDNNDSRIDHLYQFGLSPIDEATQAAMRIAHDGHSRVILMTQNGEWNQKVVAAFEKQWQSEGGQIVTRFSFGAIADLNNGIPRLLNIEDSQHRARSLQSVVHEKLRYTMRRRQDFDAIFLVATPDLARQILPLLRFYYTGSIPVYATSSIYSGIPRTSVDEDLNGVIFDDMPWVLNNPNMPQNLVSLRDNVHSLWPSSYQRYSRLYALGVDAYQVIPNLEKLSNSAQTSVMGATGQLYLLPNQHLYRQLPWAKMMNGVPAALSQ